MLVLLLSLQKTLCIWGYLVEVLDPFLFNSLRFLYTILYHIRGERARTRLPHKRYPCSAPKSSYILKGRMVINYDLLLSPLRMFAKASKNKLG